MVCIEESEIYKFMSNLIVNKVTSGLPLELSKNFPSDQSIMLRYTHHDEEHIDNILTELKYEIDDFKQKYNSEINFSYNIEDKFSMFEWPIFEDWNFSNMNTYYFVKLQNDDKNFFVNTIKEVYDESNFNMECEKIREIYTQNIDNLLLNSIIAKGKEKLLVIDLKNNPQNLTDIIFNKLYMIMSQFVYKIGKDAENSYKVPYILMKKKDGIKGLMINASISNIDSDSNLKKNLIVTPVDLVIFKRKGFLSDSLFNINGKEYTLYSVVPKKNKYEVNYYSFDKFYKRVAPLINKLKKDTNVNIELKYEQENVYTNGLFADYIFKKFERGYK